MSIRMLFAQIAACSVLLGCAATDSRLLLLSNADGDQDIYVVSENGLQQITANNYDDSQASWSPNGYSIVYTSNLSGNPEIYISNLDAGNPKRLTNHRGLDAWPRWSPDGTRIVFVSTRTGRESLFVMDADGRNVTELTPATQSANLPVWSPTGDTVAFLERHEGEQSIAIIDANGRNHRTLVKIQGATGLTWSPDGTSLLYSSTRDKNVDIYRSDLATGIETQLTTDPWIDAEPAWSPDSTKIVWLSARDDFTRRQVYVMNADGSHQRALTADGAEHLQPSWSPDGKQVAYVAYANRRFVLHVMDIASRESGILGEDRLGGNHFQPVFNPRGGHVSLATIALQANESLQTSEADSRLRLAQSQPGEIK